MKTTKALSSLALALAAISLQPSVSLASDLWVGQHVPVTAGKTRAEVQAEAVEAVRSGQIQYGESLTLTTEKITGRGRTRSDVRAEAVDAIRSGSTQNGETLMLPIQDASAPTRTSAKQAAQGYNVGL